ncbi:squalene synthase HpnC [Ideonella sp.]|uniref:squalene synthase HpnC n=1 Tax=Ideonella sp. TaxID=1929293 RepID=UPI0037C07272
MSVDHYENFPVASWLCPPALRPAVTAIYWFARTADDLADEGQASPEQRRADLTAYRRDLHSAYSNEPVSPRWAAVFDPLREAIRMHRLPSELLSALLDAFEQDTYNQPFPDRPALLAYCSRSANPVGRLLLHLYGIGQAQALQQSDAICSALQLINFWQDLSRDLPRGRHYVADSDLRQFGLSRAKLSALSDSAAPDAAAQALVRDLVQWAKELMLQGQPLVHTLPGRAGWELRLVVLGGLRILEKIEAMNFHCIAHRPRLTAWDAPALIWRALWMRAQ